MKASLRRAFLAFAFCGLGNPDNFFAQLRQENIAIVGTRAFRDHHFYSQDDIDALNKDAGKAAAQVLLTTCKDAVKLTGLTFALPCFATSIKIEMDDEDAFASML